MHISGNARHGIWPALRVVASQPRRPHGVTLGHRQYKASRRDVCRDGIGTELLERPDRGAMLGCPRRRLDQKRRDARRFCRTSEPNLDSSVRHRVTLPRIGPQR